MTKMDMYEHIIVNQTEPLKYGALKLEGPRFKGPLVFRVASGEISDVVWRSLCFVFALEAPLRRSQHETGL